MTPSFFRQVETSWNLTFLKTFILGGEPFPHLSNSTITKLIREGKRVINIYGLTEMSCWASYYILNEKDLEYSRLFFSSYIEDLFLDERMRFLWVIHSMKRHGNSNQLSMIQQRTTAFN